MDLEQKYENVWISNKDTFYHYIDRKERPWEYIYLIGEKLIHTDKSLALFAYDSPVLLGDSFLITSFPDKVFFVNFKEAFIDEFKGINNVHLFGYNQNLYYFLTAEGEIGEALYGDTLNRKAVFGINDYIHEEKYFIRSLFFNIENVTLCLLQFGLNDGGYHNVDYILVDLKSGDVNNLTSEMYSNGIQGDVNISGYADKGYKVLLQEKNGDDPNSYISVTMDLETFEVQNTVFNYVGNYCGIKKLNGNFDGNLYTIGNSVKSRGACLYTFNSNGDYDKAFQLIYNNELVNKEILSNLSKNQLVLLVNLIFAKNGFDLKEYECFNYFRNYVFYFAKEKNLKPINNELLKETLSETDKANYAFIIALIRNFNN